LAPSPESDALVTQTPTSLTPPPTTQPGNTAVSPSSQARAELPDLSNHNADAASNNENTNTIPSDFLAKAAATPPPAPTPPGEISNQPLQDAKAKVDAGDLIASRQLLNDALISGRLGDSDADAAKKQIEEINQTLVFSAKRFTNDSWGGVYQVASGERLATIAGRNAVTWELLSRVNGVTPRRLRSGQNIKIFKGPFHAIVYKHSFKMEIYLGAPGGAGSMYIASYPVGLGKDNSTPTGLWLCKAGDKIRNPRYYPPHGGEILAPDDPKNPLGGYWIAIEGQDGQALGKESYGIHGTTDPGSIGKMESMGCIRLKSEDISWVFDFLVDGKSKVLVKD
jgi:lipoprotein-anchoring transpeptidase ErfK/SrfK